MQIILWILIKQLKYNKGQLIFNHIKLNTLKFYMILSSPLFLSKKMHSIQIKLKINQKFKIQIFVYIEIIK
ncbi:hypothetical protein PW52_14830 [Tamlana sedimentorum]|uniref:Uncharacterized protein n=1 Tax=Neotamlana sedimentorum TaxID=1435349 RepID=A0A0D7W5U8_9FLAO|nr:hypothetical protein PW52_14830 [Tamlana sedimentorum]